MKTIAFTTGKGGTGKTTSTIEVCKNLPKKYKRGILDLDLLNPNVLSVLGINVEELKYRKRGINTEKPVVVDGIKVLSLEAIFTEDEDYLSWGMTKLLKTLEQFIAIISNEDIDYLCVDTPPGSGVMTKAIVSITKPDGVVIVSTGNRAALKDSKKTIALLKTKDCNILGAIDNMNYIVGNDKKRVRLHDGDVTELGLPILGIVPYVTDKPTKIWGQISKKIVRLVK